MAKRINRAVLLLWACASAALADDEPFGSVYKMPVWIDGVSRVCPWKSPTAQGYIRVVRSAAEGRSQLFLQWIRQGGMTDGQIVSTMQVRELDQYHVALPMPEARLAADACHLIIRADTRDMEHRYQFDVVLKGPGQYRVDVTQSLPGGT